MYAAIMILPIESTYGIPKYPARTLANPTNDADPSLIEFFASNFREIKLYFLAILCTQNALCSDMIAAASRVIKVIS